MNSTTASSAETEQHQSSHFEGDGGATLQLFAQQIKLMSQQLQLPMQQLQQMSQQQMSQQLQLPMQQLQQMSQQLQLLSQQQGGGGSAGVAGMGPRQVSPAMKRGKKRRQQSRQSKANRRPNPVGRDGTRGGQPHKKQPVTRAPPAAPRQVPTANRGIHETNLAHISNIPGQSCNLCSAQYPTQQGLTQHKQTFHNESGSELVFPVDCHIV